MCGGWEDPGRVDGRKERGTEQNGRISGPLEGDWSEIPFSRDWLTPIQEK